MNLFLVNASNNFGATLANIKDIAITKEVNGANVYKMVKNILECNVDYNFSNHIEEIHTKVINNIMIILTNSLTKTTNIFNKLNDNFNNSKIINAKSLAMLSSYLEGKGYDDTFYDESDTNESNKTEETFLSEANQFQKFFNHNLYVWNSATDTSNIVNSRRIFNGSPSAANEYPFIASIHIKGKFTCCGSVINKKFILSAASCFQTLYVINTPYDVSVVISARTGSDFVNDQGVLIPIVALTIHPQYNPATLRNNLALVEIGDSTYFKRHKNIKRILYKGRENLRIGEGESFIILGWGSHIASQTNFKFKTLSSAILQVVNQAECKKLYTANYVTYKHFCGGIASRGSGAFILLEWSASDHLSADKSTPRQYSRTLDIILSGLTKSLGRLKINHEI
ncbi:unnamed protein product [Leptidea sinapis]|uniref:Peptidase S1 domain-containing protein n=1 Tax=Leptidea sinapis TaxID=189913 RepID=A0A5E4PU95_9NEOP|nr:unnamed protein product [Leptidea sinapis]